MNGKILITGATGNTGLETLKSLTFRDLSVVAALRNPEKDKNFLPSGVECVLFDFENPDTYETAVKRVNKVYLVRPPAISDVKRYIKPFIEFLKGTEVKHIVFLSLIGADKNHFVPHYKIEKYILEAGIPYTFHSKDIKENNEVFIPAGKGKTSFIDVRDIAVKG